MHFLEVRVFEHSKFAMLPDIIFLLKGKIIVSHSCSYFKTVRINSEVKSRAKQSDLAFFHSPLAFI